MLKKQEQLQSNMLRLLDQAKRRVHQIEISALLETGYSIDARMGDVETLEHHRENSLDITVYHHQRCASASTSDLSLKAMKAAFEKACAIAQFTQYLG